jgi:formiminotetrahydrofolate cyclodeaminase
MSLAQRPFVDLLGAFRSPQPTPGGGSASALAAAVGASLLAMVAALAKPEAESADDVKSLHSAGERCASLSDRLSVLMDEDTAAYNDVVAAFKLPKGTDAEKSARSLRIQEALRGATEVPLEVMRACAEALRQGAIVARFGNRNARSDVQVGLELLAAGMRGARLNVDINLQSLKDVAYVAAVRGEADRLANGAGQDQRPGGSLTR